MGPFSPSTLGVSVGRGHREEQILVRCYHDPYRETVFNLVEGDVARYGFLLVHI